MRRDWELVRMLLLKVEESDDIEEFLGYENGEWRFSGDYGSFSQNQILYHVILLINEDFIWGNLDDDDNDIKDIYGLTWKGHEYAEKLRSSPRWEKIKEEIRKKGLDLGTDTIMGLIRKGIGGIGEEGT